MASIQVQQKTTTVVLAVEVSARCVVVVAEREAFGCPDGLREVMHNNCLKMQAWWSSQTLMSMMNPQVSPLLIILLHYGIIDC